MSVKNLTILDFPDCLLLNLLEYLDTTSLYNLTKVHERFENLVLEPSLWKKIDARATVINHEKNQYCIQRINKNTSLLCLSGSYSTKLPFFVNPSECGHLNLKILALEEQILDGSDITLNQFPSTLTELSFKNSSILNEANFFKKTSDTMKNLRVLLLDCCSPLDSSIVMSVSKYQNLEIVSFYYCKISNSIPYFSIAGRHGFKKLKVLDARMSGLGRDFLRCVVKISELSALYFQDSNSSFILDFDSRKLELESQAAPDSPKIEMITTWTTFEDSLITDDDTFEFKHLRSNGNKFEHPQSFLYEDPYKSCKCSRKGSQNVLKNCTFKPCRIFEVPLSHKRKHSDEDDENESCSSTKYRKHNNLLRNCGNSNPWEPSTSSCSNRVGQFENAPPDENLILNSRNIIRVSVLENRLFINGFIPVIREEFNDWNNREIVHHSCIKRLSFRGFQGVTDHTLIWLENLNLELLDVTYTKITKDGVENFLKTNPNCRVIHESFCTCIPRLHF